MNKNVLKYFYIREGKTKLLEYFESAVNKKKQKKGVSSGIQFDVAPIQFNFFKFVQTDTIKNPRYFLNQQLINSLQGKGLEKKFGKDNQKPSIQSLQENLNKFRILHKKIVQKLTLEEPSQKMSLKKIKQILVIKKSLSLFGSLFQNDDFCQKIKANKEFIYALKKKRLTHYEQNSEKIRFQIFIFLDNINKHLQLRQLHQSYISHNRITYAIQKDKETIQNKINFLISNCLEGTFTKLLDSIRLKQILTITKLKKNWEAATLLKEQNEIISNKITGKILYSVQQTTIKLKAELKNKNTMREYYIRQKKHNFNTNNNSKPIKIIEFDTENMSQKSNQNLQKSRNKNLNGVIREIPKRNYSSVMIQKSNNKKKTNYLSSKEKRINQTQTIDQCSLPKYRKYHVSNLTDLKSSSKKSPILKSNLSQSIKPNRIKPFDINSLEQYAYNSISQNNRNDGRTQPAISYTNLKVFKYPIKIGCFQILSPQNSYICYNIQECSLKQLPLKFIRDRIQFKENKVKIQYPYNFSAEIEIKVAKSLQILTCLGAEVTCQMQSSYQHWNQIDEIQIMSASWVLEMHMKQVIDCYANFFCVKHTKK